MTYLYEELSAPARLYIKQCSHCSLKYFGKTSKEDIESYRGSGVRWLRHLNKHKAESIHLWNSNWYYDQSIAKAAMQFSIDNNIKEEAVWANLKNENGLDGGWDYHSDETKKKIQIARASQVITEETRKKMSATRKGRQITWDTKAHTKEANAKRSKTASGKPKPKVMCPHCGKEGGLPQMVQWHFDNCKEKAF